jgi:hypothetical protein
LDLQPPTRDVLQYATPKPPARWDLTRALATIFSVVAISVGGLLFVGWGLELVSPTPQATTADALRRHDDALRMCAVGAVLLMPGIWYGAQVIRRRTTARR